FSLFSPVPTTPAIYTLSLHDALPISSHAGERGHAGGGSGDSARHRGRDAARHPHFRSARRLLPSRPPRCSARHDGGVLFERHDGDRKSTRLNSSHLGISYAVFCLKKK